MSTRLSVTITLSDLAAVAKVFCHLRRHPVATSRRVGTSFFGSISVDFGPTFPRNVFTADVKSSLEIDA
jgi:hypothetical protein